jgi:hypothetical protein
MTAELQREATRQRGHSLSGEGDLRTSEFTQFFSKVIKSLEAADLELVAENQALYNADS